MYKDGFGVGVVLGIVYSNKFTYGIVGLMLPILPVLPVLLGLVRMFRVLLSGPKLDILGMLFAFWGPLFVKLFSPLWKRVLLLGGRLFWLNLLLGYILNVCELLLKLLGELNLLGLKFGPVGLGKLLDRELKLFWELEL